MTAKLLLAPIRTFTRRAHFRDLTVAELGVEFGQGYWFGRPEPVS